MIYHISKLAKNAELLRSCNFLRHLIGFFVFSLVFFGNFRVFIFFGGIHPAMVLLKKHLALPGVLITIKTF